MSPLGSIAVIERPSISSLPAVRTLYLLFSALDWVVHKRTFIGVVEAGEPLIQQAVDALREYHQAQDRGAPADEVERLHLLAESLFQAVTDYQLRVIAKVRGAELPKLH